MQDKYLRHRLTLNFLNPETELSYRKHIVELTTNFCRFAWTLFLLAMTGFALLDSTLFPADYKTILGLRLFIILISATMLSATFIPKLRPLLLLSSAIFISIICLFSIFLTSLKSPTDINPYFLGIFFSIGGILILPGIGFISSVWAMAISLGLFLIITGVFSPVSQMQFIVHCIFLPPVFVIFTYGAYVIERIARQNYSVSARLEESLEEVKALSGLLPICASCKSIRNDQGYWAGLECYFAEHSELEFSHGICPPCMFKLYPDHAAEIEKEDQEMHRQRAAGSGG
ncbi:MAG: hypothetical protein KUG79_15250 [Pseudomonadales bacterium]|nr:hypothetical protein [Pseudomonadales bacterium]